MTSFPRSLKKHLAKMRVKRIPSGQILFYEGDRPVDVYFVKSGVVKMHDIDMQGNEKILDLLGASSALPFAVFSEKRQNPARWYYTALTDCEVWVISRKELNELIGATPELAVYFMNWFFDEVHELLVRLDSMGKTNTREKLIVALRFLAVRHCYKAKGSRWSKVKFPVNHQLIANLIGMTRESTSIAMKELSDDSVIRYKKGSTLEINKRKLLTLDSVA